MVYSSVVTQIEMDGQENESRQNRRVFREGGGRDLYFYNNGLKGMVDLEELLFFLFLISS